jgi:hypothetical protein
MPIRHTDKGWYWGSQGPFASKDKALQVARAAHANGFKEEDMDGDLDNEYSVQEFTLYLLHSVTNCFAIIELCNHVEAYQGKYGIITGYESEYTTPPPALEYLVGLADYVNIARQSLPQDIELQNIIAEIAQLLDSTIYKLRFLK